MIIRGDVSCANGTCLERHGIYPCPCPDRVETDMHGMGHGPPNIIPRRWIIGRMGPRSVACMPNPNTIRGIISGSRGMLYKVRHGRGPVPHARATQATAARSSCRDERTTQTTDRPLFRRNIPTCPQPAITAHLRAPCPARPDWTAVVRGCAPPVHRSCRAHHITSCINERFIYFDFFFGSIGPGFHFHSMHGHRCKCKL